MAKPKLALIPAAQGSKFYSVLPSSGVGDFDFTRSGSATRINSQGLIETVANGVSRLNYPLIDGKVVGCPSHLLENSSTNLITYSEDFTQSYWSKVRASILSNQTISPNGTLNADLLTVTDTAENYVQTNVTITVSGTKQTVSCFVKKGTNDFSHILLWDSSSNGSRQWFDVNNGTIGSSSTFGSGISVDSASIENYGNGWFRCIVVFNCSLTSVRTRISASNGDGQTNGTIGKTIYIWGLQAESNSSYITSYIPSLIGSQTTRSAETANGSGDAATFNDSEGVLMAEIAYLKDRGTSSPFKIERISISDSSDTNRLFISNTATSNQIQVFVRNSVGISFNKTVTISDNTLYNKIVLKYKANDYSLWINGFKLESDNTFDYVPSGLNVLKFEGASGSYDFEGKTKQIQYYDSALTDSELETLTSWVSFSDMANGQLYTIE